MIKARRTWARLVVAAGAALTALCAGTVTAVQPALAATFVPISGAGSTWSFNAIRSWTANVAAMGMTVNYSAVGSTSGRTEFKEGVVNFGASEIPYGVRDGNNFDPPPVRGFTYIPDTAGGLAFMYNLHIGTQQVTNLRLSGAVIAGIFTNQITMWNDPKIAADNPGLTLPAEQIVPVVRTDGSGDTAQLTGWMNATQSSFWSAYCAVVGRSPCTPTSAYPVQPGTNMIGQGGDLGVSGYVSQAGAEGAIGYVPYATALETGFPVAKVLNAAGYYTAPTPGHVGVSLLQAQINNNPSDPLFGTADLSQVYTDTDPRTYELSYYSYMILPTDTSFGLTADQGFTLGAFGQYLLCQGQQQVDALGYAALPINLAEAGYAQLQKVPGASLPATTSAFIASCNNPTFAPDGTNTLASTDPMPPACDQQGPVQCAAIISSAVGLPVTFTIPTSGSFTFTVAPGTVNLTESGSNATGALPAITVSDTRNTYPGWSVSGQESDFTGSGTAAGSTISGNQLGWVPTDTSLGTGVTLGGTVAPGSPGLGTTAAVLASAHAGSGFGTSVLGANLTLAIPALARAGDYAGSLTVTAVTALP
jgi:ABC-type phosphate transport system substrate-binding protein